MSRKNLTTLIVVCGSLFAYGQSEFANWTRSNLTSGTGSFSTVNFPNFTYTVTPSTDILTHAVDNSENFNGVNTFEDTYGQADNEENLNLGVRGNSDPAGMPITETITLTINFNVDAPSSGWAFCLIDFDVDQAIISARDDSNNPVSNATISSWLVQLFDATGSGDVPRWDATNAALLGNATPSSYTTYSNLIQSGISDNEAGAAYFEPDISLSSLSIQFESLSSPTATYHIYLAANQSLLPLNLIDFVAQEMDGSVLVEWQTASEVNADRFVLERSSNGTDFATLFSTSATQSEGGKYAFEDHLPLLDMNYYRLKQIDLDGSEDFSEVRSVSLSKSHAGPPIQVYPNPASSHLQISMTKVKQGHVFLFDISGQLIFEQQISDDLQINLEKYGIRPGAYYMECLAHGHRSVTRLMVQ